MDYSDYGQIVIGYSTWKDGIPDGLPVIGRYTGKMMSGHYEVELGEGYELCDHIELFSEESLSRIIAIYDKQDED